MYLLKWNNILMDFSCRRTTWNVQSEEDLMCFLLMDHDTKSNVFTDLSVSFCLSVRNLLFAFSLFLEKVMA